MVQVQVGDMYGKKFFPGRSTHFIQMYLEPSHFSEGSLFKGDVLIIFCMVPECDLNTDSIQRFWTIIGHLYYSPENFSFPDDIRFVESLFLLTLHKSQFPCTLKMQEIAC